MTSGFLRRIAQGGGLSAVKLLTGLVKIKVLASVLGVEGVGLLSLGLQFQATAVGLVSMSLAVGVINLGRPAWVAGDAAAAGQVLGTALALVAFNASVFLAVVALFGQAFGSGWLAAFEAHGASLWPLALAAVVVSFANVLWEGLSFLVDRFDVYVRSNMVAAVCDAGLFSLGAWAFGLPGALAASLLGSLVLFAIYTVFSARAAATRQILAHLRVQRARIRPLLSYSVLMLSTTALGLSCLFAARAHLTAVAGESANGYLQVVTALSAYLLPFVMTGVWGHLHPVAAASGDTPGARNELHRTLVASMRLGCAGCVAVVVSAPLLVSVVYTRSFLDAQPYIPVYFAADLGTMFVSVLGAYLLAVGHKRVYFIGYAAYHGLLLAGVLLAAARWGAWAYVLAHAVAAAGVSALTLLHALRSGLLDTTTLRTVGGCMLAALAVCALDHIGAVVPLGALAPRASWLLGPVVILVLLAPLLQRRLPRWGRA